VPIRLGLLNLHRVHRLALRLVINIDQQFRSIGNAYKHPVSPISGRRFDEISQTDRDITSVTFDRQKYLTVCKASK